MREIKVQKGKHIKSIFLHLDLTSLETSTASTEAVSPSSIAPLSIANYKSLFNALSRKQLTLLLAHTLSA